MNIKKYIFIVLSLVFIQISCSKDSAMEADSPSGQGGSLARFTISNGHLYTVDNQTLRVFDITDEKNPIFIKNLNIGWGIETIFPRGNTLFIGSQTGMVIYDISTPNNPIYYSFFSHIYSCDPVVVEGDYAYVTLSVSSSCSRGVNELQVINISNLQSPQLVATYPMINPKGLGIDNGKLFVCDAGLKVYDASNPTDLKLLQTFDVQANDVIPYDGLLLLIGDNGFYQYDYSDGNLQFLSKLEIQL
jgi:hypothetical protein